jgi:hypothetical protein
MFCYLYVDLAMMIFRPQAYLGIAAKLSEWAVLAFAALMLIPIAMIPLARLLPYRANRWANIVAGIESTAFVGVTLVGGKGPLFYWFFSIIEMITTLYIVWYAARWRESDA